LSFLLLSSRYNSSSVYSSLIHDTHLVSSEKERKE
jgi:hypothetical protein